jgi:hypothetical protein
MIAKILNKNIEEIIINFDNLFVNKKYLIEYSILKYNLKINKKKTPNDFGFQKLCFPINFIKISSNIVEVSNNIINKNSFIDKPFSLQIANEVLNNDSNKHTINNVVLKLLNNNKIKKEIIKNNNGNNNIENKNNKISDLDDFLLGVSNSKKIGLNNNNSYNHFLDLFCDNNFYLSHTNIYNNFILNYLNKSYNSKYNEFGFNYQIDNENNFSNQKEIMDFKKRKEIENKMIKDKILKGNDCLIFYSEDKKKYDIWKSIDGFNMHMSFIRYDMGFFN